MEYKALYRKYRPNNFVDVIGQVSIVKTLQNIIKENKISHAYLFNGPRGTGKTSVAKLFAKSINCLQPKDGAPCDKCAICNQMKEDYINDIIEIDAASNNGVDEIRELKSKVNLAPSICKYKVYIIDEVHMLSMGAFNALLKTLEEPPHHVVFILATTEIHKLPLTIISRCQNFNFKKLTEEEIKKRLDYIATEEHINVDSNALYEIAKISDGGMRDAIGLLEQSYLFTDNNITVNDVNLLSSSVSRDEIVSVIENIVNNNVEAMFNAINRFYKMGKDFIRITEDLVVFMKDILLYKKAKNYFINNSNYNIENYSLLLNKLDDDFIYNLISELNKMIDELKNSNHPKIIFEVMMLKMMDIKQDLCLPKEESNKMEEQIVEDKSSDLQELKLTGKSTIKKESITTENDLLPFVNIPLYKKLLINNTLAIADKKLLNELNEKRNQLQTFLLNKDFKQAATILLDGKMVGASDQYIIYTYPYDAMVEKADNLQDEIELLIDNIMGKKFKLLNITEDNWSEIRPYYVKLMKEKKKIEILPEVNVDPPKKNSRAKKRPKEIEDAITMFGEDLIEIK